MMRRTRRIILVLLLLAFAAYALTPAALPTLLRYLFRPDFPTLRGGERIALEGLEEPVEIDQYPDGRFRISARSEMDLYRAHGYLQARDRLFQMDLFRHIAQGRLAEMVGDVPFGRGTSLDLDRFNRFLGFTRQAEVFRRDADETQRAHLHAYSAGVNAWIRTGTTSLEHRLLGLEVEPWRAEDTITVMRYLAFGLVHNYSREARRLLIACEAGLGAMERIWPTGIEFDAVFLPREDIPKRHYRVPPAVVAEMTAALDRMCPQRTRETAAVPRSAATTGPALASLRPPPSPPCLFCPDAVDGALSLFRDGMSSSNNWVVAGARTASGAAVLANDPHLPHMNPPVLWGVHHVLPDREVVGFTFPGLHHIIFGHNFHVAWGATVNNVDLQDLYVEKLPPLASDPSRLDENAYVYGGKAHPFTRRQETFAVRGAESVVASVRYSVHGLVLNDVDPFLRDRIPVTTLRQIPVEGAGDLTAIEGIARARSAAEFVDAIGRYDTACMSWLFADTNGRMGFLSPCRVPVRPGWMGTFPVPGWLEEYEWQGFVPKRKLPHSFDPARGWLATSNNRALPRDRFPTAYNNDPSPPSRYLRESEALQAMARASVADMAALQLDTRLPYWPRVRAGALAHLCGDSEVGRAASAARQALCSWNGDMGSDSVAATVYTLFLHALTDRAFADELPGGANGEVWDYVQSIPHLETNVDWLWKRRRTDAVWDDVNTPAIEGRDALVDLAFADAVSTGIERYGADVSLWQWGSVRPFELRHPLGGANRLLRRVLNAAPLPGRGAPETVFKNHFLRSDREEMHVMMGPISRMVIDMHDPAAATFSLAGGQSGWARSPFYADLLPDWMENRMRALTPADADTWVRAELVPVE